MLREVHASARSGTSATLMYAGMLAVIAGSASIRWPGLTQGRFASHDVGGILYNSMLLRSGGLPYVDSVEWKAPGSFYIAALVAGPAGTDIAALQLVANLVALGSLILVMALAWRLWGRGAALACGAVFALHDAQLDSMDANYVTWALLPQIAAVAVAVGRRGRPAPSGMSWMAAGVLCGMATLCKQPAGIVLIPVMAHALRSAGKWDLRAGAWVLLGFFAAHAPIGLHYLAHGQLGALLASYAGANWGLSYIGHHADTPLHLAAWEGLAATVFFLALPLMLAVFAATARPRGVSSATTRLLWIWALAAIAGAAVGLRFYKGYFLAALPPLCLLAAAPWGILGAEFWRRGVWRWVAAPLLALLVARAGMIVHATRVDRARPHDDGARKLGEHIARNSEPGARIWVWGWHLWGVYVYSGRLSASPIYKTPGLLTRFDDDTWRRPSTPVTLLPDSPHAARLLGDLDVARPVFIVLGGSVPREQFVALRHFLAAHYERDRRIIVGKVEIWRRRDPADTD